MNNRMSFQSLVDSKVLTPTGKDWLITALDPFHDNSLMLEGFPDAVSTLSRVTLKTSTMTISSPNGSAYKARVWTGHTCSDVAPTLSLASGNSSYLEFDDADGGPIGIVTADAWTGASDPNGDQIGATFTRQAVPAKTNDAPGRLIALGIEVHNTTSPLYRQGTVTCSSINTSINHWDAYIKHYLLPADAYQSVDVHTLPPTDSATALLTPNSTQWEAEEGAYMVARLNSNDLPIDSEKPRFYAWSTNGGVVYSKYMNNCSVYDTSHLIVSNRTGFHGFNRPYMIFEGLSAETTLVVTVRSYVEYFPTFTDATLMPLATPSPPLDVEALKLYSQIAPSLPMAVPVHMNAAGDFFRIVTSIMSRAIPKVVPLLSAFNPMAGQVLSTVGSVAKSVNKAIQPRKRKQKQKQKQVGWGTLGGSQGSANIRR